MFDIMVEMAKIDFRTAIMANVYLGELLEVINKKLNQNRDEIIDEYIELLKDSIYQHKEQFNDCLLLEATKEVAIDQSDCVVIDCNKLWKFYEIEIDSAREKIIQK
jgi:cellulose biosynthesis protein BcsQ